jgi:hypothetical protein
MCVHMRFLFRQKSPFSQIVCLCLCLCISVPRMLTYADVCWRMLTYANACWRMLTHADACWRMLMSADVCWCLLTYADVCWRAQHVEAHVARGRPHVCWHMPTYADICWHMLTYARHHTSARYRATCGGTRRSRTTRPKGCASYGTPQRSRTQRFAYRLTAASNLAVVNRGGHARPQVCGCRKLKMWKKERLA